jgi:hypothetical protein
MRFLGLELAYSKQTLQIKLQTGKIPLTTIEDIGQKF